MHAYMPAWLLGYVTPNACVYGIESVTEILCIFLTHWVSELEQAYLFIFYSPL